MWQLSYRTLFRFNSLLLLFSFILFYYKHDLQLLISRKNLITSKPNLPKIARVLYLFLCENQDEINTYSKIFPSITADVMFFCWRENCNDRNFSKFRTYYVTQYSESISKHQSFVRFDLESNYIKIQSRVFIINEHQSNLTEKTTWTTARNILLEKALVQERRQGWRWAYFNFADGDIQVDCPLTEKLLKANKTDGDEIIFAEHFRLLTNKTINNDHCFLLIDVFLLSVSPAIGVIAGMYIPEIYNGLLSQIVYHIDAMFNAFHRDAIPFVLPYCTRYDKKSWWTSQAILIYRSLCFYGHVIQFNSVRIIRQKHRKYPHKGNPWAIDQDMNLVPLSLIPLQIYMKQSRLISTIVLRHYKGWTLEMTNDECRQGHTFIDPLTCKVSGEQNKTSF